MYKHTNDIKPLRRHKVDLDLHKSDAKQLKIVKAVLIVAMVAGLSYFYVSLDNTGWF